MRVRAIVALLLAAAVYVALRFAMNEQFEGATWKSLMALEAPLPYGHRVLIPVLSRPLVSAGMPIAGAFAFFEWLATVGLIAAAYRSLRHWIAPRPAVVLAGGLLFVLPLAYLLDHRWPIFYPWDTPGMMVVAAAVFMAAEERPGWAVVLTALGAINRETAVVVPAVYVLLRFADGPQRQRTFAWAGLMVVAFVLAREAIAVALPDNAGEPIRWVLEGEFRVLSNLRWLSDPRNALAWLGALGMLPLAWWLVWPHVPTPLRRLHLLALALLGGLLLVANAYEPRAFGEVLILGYLPVAAGVWMWTTGRSEAGERDVWTTRLDRYGALAVALAWIGVVGWMMTIRP